MARLVKFNRGSVIFLEGEGRKKGNVYLLKEGTVTVQKTKPETSEQQQTTLRKGDFFGIKSGLAPLRRDETVRAQSDCVVYEFSPQEFTQVLTKNIKIIMKMLKSLSNELRSIHRAIEASLSEEKLDNSERLFGIAEYYFKQNSYLQALYAYKKYLELYPDKPYQSKALVAIKNLTPLIGQAAKESW